MITMTECGNSVQTFGSMSQKKIKKKMIIFKLEHNRTTVIDCNGIRLGT